MFVWGHIDEVIFQITEAVAIAMMTDLTDRCFSDHSVHIDPVGSAIVDD